MHSVSALQERLSQVFKPKQAEVLSTVITEAYSELVKTSDFSELKAIVKDLAEAQKRTEIRVEELADAQKRTDIKMGELADEMKDLAQAMKETRGDVGGLARSMGYALENEAYRMAPIVLKQRHKIDLQEKLIRQDIGGKEINIFGKAVKAGKEILVVGEVKTRLDERRKNADVFKELDDKVKAVIKEYGKKDILKVLITHYATKGFLKKAKEKGVAVIQSFEW